MIVLGYGTSLDVDYLTYSVLDLRTSQPHHADSYRALIITRARAISDQSGLIAGGVANGVRLGSPWIQRDLNQAPSRRLPPILTPRAVPGRDLAQLCRNTRPAMKISSVPRGHPPAAQPVKFEPRALQPVCFESVYAMVPGDIMLL